MRRIEAIAARRVAAAKARVREMLAGVPGLCVEEAEAGVVVQGWRLKSRWIGDPRLRWLGGWM